MGRKLKQIDENISDDIVLQVARAALHDRDRRLARQKLFQSGYDATAASVNQAIEMYHKRSDRLGLELAEYGEMIEDCKQAVSESPVERLPAWVAGVGVDMQDGAKYLTRIGSGFVAVYCVVWTDLPVPAGIEVREGMWIFMAKCCGACIARHRLAEMLDHAAETADTLWGEESENMLKACADVADD